MRAGICTVALSVMAISVTTASTISAEREDDHLAEIREATERYKDVEVAQEDGYVRDPDNRCMTASKAGFPRQLGGMGVHYLRPELLGITDTEPRVAGEGTHTDFMTPGVLVYEPQPDGLLDLVAVENLVFAEAWHAEDHEGPPTFHGNEYHHMIDNPRTEIDEGHGFRPHYELHIWLYRNNPNGRYAQYNPNVTCKHHEQT